MVFYAVALLVVASIAGSLRVSSIAGAGGVQIWFFLFLMFLCISFALSAVRKASRA
jgi:uncharacterized membrane protein YtjA (UPF0391 family)